MCISWTFPMHSFSHKVIVGDLLRNEHCICIICSYTLHLSECTLGQISMYCSCVRHVWATVFLIYFFGHVLYARDLLGPVYSCLCCQDSGFDLDSFFVECSPTMFALCSLWNSSAFRFFLKQILVLCLFTTWVVGFALAIKKGEKMDDSCHP